MSSYNEAALDAYEDEVDRNEAFDAALEEARKAAHLELKTELLSAMNHPSGKHRVTVVHGQTTGRPYREEQTSCAAIFDVVNMDGIGDRKLVFEPIFLKLLAAESPEHAFELLEKLKTTIAETHADDYAEGLARANLRWAERYLRRTKRHI